VLSVFFQVLDHAHDRNLSVNKIIKQNNTYNSHDRWHVAKAASKAMKAISAGAKKNLGKTWHPELGDKVTKVRNHLYWAMEHCEGDVVKLRRLLDSVVPHFMNQHDVCDPSSTCRLPDYIPNFDVIIDQRAVKLLQDFMHSTAVFKKPADYVHARDTFLVESFNNVVLIYLDKRIHYKDLVYKMRRNLAVLDWNENVSREYTSVWRGRSSSHQQRASGKRRYKVKQFAFVEKIWQSLTAMLLLPDTGSPSDSSSTIEYLSDVEAVSDSAQKASGSSIEDGDSDVEGQD
jgi:hypothetical protein